MGLGIESQQFHQFISFSRLLRELKSMRKWVKIKKYKLKQNMIQITFDMYEINTFIKILHLSIIKKIPIHTHTHTNMHTHTQTHGHVMLSKKQKWRRNSFVNVPSKM